MSINRQSMIFSFTSWVIYILIGCRHPFIKYWQPLQTSTTASYSLSHPENECQLSVNDFWLCIVGNLCSIVLQTNIYALLAPFIGKNNSEMLHAAL
jgi:hypothetical protein